MNDFIAQSAALRKKLLTLFSLITVMLSGSFQAHGVGYHRHFMFIDENGSLWGMGGNGNYELGLGNTGTQTTPQEILSSGVVQVATNLNHSLFIKISFCRSGEFYIHGSLFDLVAQYAHLLRAFHSERPSAVPGSHSCPQEGYRTTKQGGVSGERCQ